MKRIISLLLVIISLMSIMLSGCSAEPKYPMTMIQWLGMVNQSFGMESYVTEEPFFNNISAESEHFATAQIAAEWEVIDSEKDFNPDAEVYWQDVLVTLVNAGNFMSASATDEEKIDFAIENFDTKIRKYWMNRKIDLAKANTLLAVAQDLWATREYAEKIEEVQYLDEVKDLTQSEIEVVNVNPVNDTIVLSAEAASMIQAGDVFVVPATETSSEKAYKAENVTVENGVAVVKTSDKELELGDIVDELYVQETVYPDLAAAEIYDGNGNLVSAGGASQVSKNVWTGDVAAQPLGRSTKNYTVEPLAAKTTFEFETSACTVKATVTSDGISAAVEFPLSKKDDSLVGTAEFEISNFKISHKIDYSWFTLHSAEVRVDYETKVTFGAEKEFVEEEAVYAPKWSNGNGSFLTNLKKSVWKDKDSVGAKTIKIGSIKVASVGVASFSVDVNAKFTVEGTVEISLTQTGAKGVEYKDGKCRVINTNDKKTEIKVECKVEGTVSVGPTVNAFGFAIIGISAQAGLGATASATVHLADAENHLLEETSGSDLSPGAYQETKPVGLTADAEAIKAFAESQGGIYTVLAPVVDLHVDVCIDITVYFIFRIGITEETLAGKLLKGTSIKVTWEICGSKNAKILNFHVDNFDFISAFQNISFFSNESTCKLEYKPFDGAEEETTTETNEEESAAFGEVLAISDMKVILAPEEKKIISVIQVPVGYELKDVVCESDNKKIATIDKNGVITGVGEGSTTVIVSTSDGKFTCACSVTVVTEESSSFAPLGSFNKAEVKGLAAV